jgi:uncharacterized protein YjbI with pentapeptide repeats
VVITGSDKQCSVKICRASRAAGYAWCLRHLGDTDRTAYLARFNPGDDFDAANTTFTWRLLDAVERAFTEPGGHAPRFGRVTFRGCEFHCDVSWGKAVFEGNAYFDEAVFHHDAWFWDAEFRGCAWFQKATFKREAGFSGAHIDDQARFDRARFEGEAKLSAMVLGDRLELGGAEFTETSEANLGHTSIAGHADLSGAKFRCKATFAGATFGGGLDTSGAVLENKTLWFGAKFIGNACFERSVFSGEARFDEAIFAAEADFTSARFRAWVYFERAAFEGDVDLKFVEFGEAVRFNEAHFAAGIEGPIACEDTIVATGARFAASLRLQVLAKHLLLDEARFESTTVLSLRRAQVDLSHTVTSAALTLVSYPTEFLSHHDAEKGMPGDARASLTSITGLDGANLVLHDIDLSQCAFSGAYHLDQIRFEGRCTFAGTPRGWYKTRGFPPIIRWTARKVLAEEHEWRARDAPGRRPAARAGWNPDGWKAPSPAPSAASLAVLYRQLRKCFEDSGNAPGADDFYYGEMEARRHDPETPWGERMLLHAYWVLSGYALRSMRALGFLLTAMTTTLLALMFVGLPDNSLNQQITGSEPSAGRPVALTVATPDAELTLPMSERFSVARAEQAAQVVVNSVIFRSSDQSLTTPGTWIEMTSRLAEPVLLGFAAFAARGRVKR